MDLMDKSFWQDENWYSVGIIKELMNVKYRKEGDI